MSSPVYCTWDGESFVPLARFAKRCDQDFVVGETYPLVVQEDRSALSHRHFFAAVNDAWRTLPEGVAEQFPNPERLRKWALIKSGFADERSIVCQSKAEAQRLKAFIQPMDSYAIVTANAAVVTVYTAKSQSVRAMGKKEFQRSKDAVLAVIDQLLGVERGETKKHAGMAA